jgi:hypothetical protein
MGPPYFFPNCGMSFNDVPFVPNHVNIVQLVLKFKPEDTYARIYVN